MSPPSAFGTYRVLHQIGSGVLGPVFRAYDSQLDRLVAIKTFTLDLVPEDAARLADRLQALVAQRAAHPAIVGAVDAGLEGATPFIALEYASGESLDVVLRQSGAAPVARALPVLREIAAAIDASWANLVGHGALHPRDIFITTDSIDVRITGFGIGQALEAIGAKAPVRRPYSAAERGNGASWDIRADVYSLGVVAYEMVSGQRPVGLGDEGDAVASELGPEARAAVRRVLAVATADSPADRYETAIACVEALTAAAQPATVVPAAQGHDGPKRASRIKRPRPIVLNLPLFADVEPPEDAGRASGPGPSEDAGGVFTAGLARGALSVSKGRPGDDGGAEAAPRSGFETHEPPVAAFPWAAVLAVLAAGLVLAGVAGYQLGWNHGSVAARSVAVAPPPGPTPTPMVPAAAEPPATSEPPTATPVRSPARAADPAPAGRLVIQSTPSGALVMVDGRRAGETPVTLSVALGRHEIQVARSGYVPRVESVNLTTRSASRTVNVQLRRGSGSVIPAAPATGSVDVDSRPAGARVTVDGRPLGTTPVRVPELTAGDHQIEIALAGHKTVTATVNIVGGELTRLAVTLERGGMTMVRVPGGIR